MATYFFETITPEQALAYNAAQNTIVFQTPGESARLTTVRYNAATAVSAATVTITSGITNRSVVFGTTANGTGIYGENDFVYPDSSTLFVGTTGNDNQPGDFRASSTTDGLYG